MNDISLLTDLYEFTMCESYLKNNVVADATFELFIRKIPDSRSYFIAMGIYDTINAIAKLRFTDKQLRYLSSIGFKDPFIKYLKNFRFKGSIRAVPEGTIIFPNEPIMSITAPIAQAQLVEGIALNTINVQTVMASKASRVVQAAQGRIVIEFGMRRSQGISASLAAAKCSYAVGAAGTSNVLAGFEFHIPVFGTMAHSYIMSFESEEEAFRAFVKSFPDKTTLLVDTYDTLQGIKKAIKVAKELEAKGYRLGAIRLDSGDMLALSKLARNMLDSNGLNYVKIFASGELDEYRIDELIRSSAPIDFFGVGTRMTTSSDAPYADVVYKLSEISKDGVKKSIMKLSDGKATLPGSKQVFRILEYNIYKRDIIGLADEEIEGKKLLEEMVKNGKVVYKMKNLEDTRAYVAEELLHLPEALKKINTNKKYEVLLSRKLEAMEQRTARLLQKI